MGITEGLREGLSRRYFYMGGSFPRELSLKYLDSVMSEEIMLTGQVNGSLTS